MMPATFIMYLLIHMADFMYNYEELMVSQIWHGLQETYKDHKCWVLMYIVSISYNIALSHDSLGIIAI